MAKGFLGAIKCKAYISNKKLKAGYVGAKKVYSAGNAVIYNVNSGIIYQEDVDEGESCLEPSFTPQIAGWTFVGWREDNTASNNVLNSKLMGNDPILLYAVFKLSVTLTCSTVSTLVNYRYYNNGNVVNPKFTVNNPSKSGYTFKGWSLTSGGSVKYSKISNLELLSNTTLYPIYSRNAQTTTIKLNSPTGGILWSIITGSQTSNTHSMLLYGNVNVMYEGRTTISSRIDCTDYKYAKITFPRLYCGFNGLYSDYIYGNIYAMVAGTSYIAYLGKIDNRNNTATDLYNLSATVNISALSGNQAIGLYVVNHSKNHGISQICIIGDPTVYLYN